MKHVLVCFFFGAALSCCKRDSTTKPYQPVQPCSDLTRNIDSINIYIEGLWYWLEEKQVDRIRGGYQYLTPETEGYTLKLKLFNGTAIFYKNNVQDLAYTFKIMRESEITNMPEDSLPVLVFFKIENGQRHTYVPIKICANFLLTEYQYISSNVGSRSWKRIN